MNFAVSGLAGTSMQQWRDSPLGDPRDWPSALRLAATLVLESPAPMWLAWDDGLALLANQACGALLPDAYRPGMPAADAWAGAWDALRPSAMRALAGQASLVEELELRRGRADGAVSAWATFSFAPLRDQENRVRGLLCTMQDMGPLVAARRALRDSEAAVALRHAQTLETAERYRLALLSTNDAIWDWNLADGHVIWNQAVQTLFGHQLDATSASWWLEHIHPDDRPLIDGTIHAVIDSQASSWSGEYRFRRADGSYAEIFDRGTVLRDAEGRALRMIGAMLDLSEQRATRAALQESERLFRTLFESIDEGFCVIEFLDGPHGPLSDYVHVLANPAYAAHTGIEDVVGQQARDMVPLEAEAWIDTYRDVLVGGQPIRFERELRHTGRFLELAALRIEPPERRQVAVLFQDITRRHRADLALRDMNDTLERRVAQELERHARMEDALRQSQKMEAVGQLTGGIAHDFNNMLAVVSNAMELLGRRLGSSDERALHYVGLAKGGVRRAAQLTQRLLAFSRQQPLQPVSVCANELVGGMSELIRHSLGGTIRVELALEGDPWLLYVDHNQLEHAILNLAVNARDAMERGGQLLIQTANRVLDRHDFVELGDSAPADYVMIAVADTGAGMPREVLAKAFDPFFTTKEVGRGTGLGLSQVYGFVKQSGGQVRIDSTPGQGTRVELYLPRHLAPGAATAPSMGAPEIVRAREAETVLVVDDEEAVRTLSADMLQVLGYTVQVADGAAAALRLLDAHPDIALLFTDVLMPELDGLQLAMRAVQRRPGLPVVFTSGHTRDVDVVDGMRLPARILAKPFTLAQLASQVRVALDGE